MQGVFFLQTLSGLYLYIFVWGQLDHWSQSLCAGLSMYLINPHLEK